MLYFELRFYAEFGASQVGWMWAYLRLFMGSGDTLKAPLSHPPAPLQWLREVGIGCRDLGGAQERSWGLIAELSSVSLLFC